MRTVLKWLVAGVGVTLVLAILASLVLYKRQKGQEVESVQAQAGSFETKEVNLGEVTVSVTPLVMEIGKQAEFEAKFDTHSVDLGLDLSEVSTLSDGSGNNYGVGIWQGSPPGGHHLEGKLKFAKPILSSGKSIRLVFKNVFEGKEASFSWDIN
ncbi:MAG: hypothetical protein UW60_C0032G0013 [Candidatus Woesebacteria bacterium GW2011_GWA2_44_33]|uniref:Uncharacterized protein n=3 Tax=Microgenomates group TaxID=1794810 RepID=A0A0G1QFX1_9BACT|nr:MAG: hypothetical protein UW61_C0036G0009 [Candidatus Curtissbacteria bacterium GW2011_GWC1_44_33]KKT65931.1 MAG: hypothetical protein UW60_C0032G0013 [Candidatus Woesebacteria bacterium GW2011_GWA2_44_33]KKU16633.1 MAG: hypothetical protein UX25_C0028G0015 [Candidatus Woesebacteria bacterium GW2011_GWC2_45_9]